MLADLIFFGAAAAGIVLFQNDVPLQSYRGRIRRNTYLGPLAVWAAYKLLQAGFPPEALLPSAEWTLFSRGALFLGAFLPGSAAMFASIGMDREQSGPGTVVAFMAGAACCGIAPVVAQLVAHTPADALALTEAWVPTAIGVWWALGRKWASD